MGRTFQITNVFSDLTLAENLALALVGTDARKWVLHRSVASFPAIREAALASLAAVGLADRADHPARHSVLRRAPSARAGAGAGDAAKAAVSRRAVRRAVGERAPAHLSHGAALPRDITLVLIEHDMDVALGLADRVTVMNRGRVMAEGAPAEVQANAQVREAYFGHA